MYSRIVILQIIILSIFTSCNPSEQELLSKSKENMKKEKYNEAVNYLDQIISRNNSNLTALNMRGVAYFELQNYALALLDFNNFLLIDSTDYKPYYNRGNVQLSLKEYEKALIDYNRAINLKPNEADLYINRATSLYHLSQYEASVEDNNFAIKLNKNNYIPYLNNGKTFIEIGGFEKATEFLNQALEINPKSGETYYWLGFIKINTDDQTGGCDDLIKAKNRGFVDAEEALKKFCD